LIIAVLWKWYSQSTRGIRLTVSVWTHTHERTKSESIVL